ncbi:MAG: hypothetical protein ACXV29_02490 [Halobacteriota archaeon]
MKHNDLSMVVCPTCRHEHEGPLKTCHACRDRIATWKQKHRGKDRLHKRKYAAKRRRSGDYDELFYSTRGQQDRCDRWIGLNPDEVTLWTGQTHAELWEEVAQIVYDEKVRDSCLGVLNGIMADVRPDYLQAMTDKRKQTECLILVKKMQLHLTNMLRENGVVRNGANNMPSNARLANDSDDRMLARYQHLYNKTRKVNALQLLKIQRAETREMCISVLLKAVVTCNNALKDMETKE